MAIDANGKCLESLSKTLRVFSATQRDEFGEEITRITNMRAAKGSLRSGGTIREVEGLMRSLLKRRSNVILTTIRELPFLCTDTVRSEVVQLVDKYMPVDFDDFRTRYIKLVHLTNGGGNVVYAALELAEKNNQLIRDALKSDIQQHFLILESESTRKSPYGILVIVEALGVGLTILLAGMWIADPSGNYEPWIVIVAMFTAGVELFRRFKPA